MIAVQSINRPGYFASKNQRDVVVVHHLICCTSLYPPQSYPLQKLCRHMTEG